jgi:hypothetical protein
MMDNRSFYWYWAFLFLLTIVQGKIQKPQKNVPDIRSLLKGRENEMYLDTKGTERGIRPAFGLCILVRNF